MNMTEQIISKETAILAKEKGFNIIGNYYYNPDNGRLMESIWFTKDRKYHYGEIGCCAQSLLAKWLREIHNIHLTVKYISTSNTYMILIHAYDPYRACSLRIWKNYNYEQALEKGLKYALKYLIKSTNSNDIR